MKIKLLSSEENYNLYKQMLEKAGFIISDTAELTFKEDDYKKDHLLGMKNQAYEIIYFKDIGYIESFGHDVTCYTLNNQYILKERLYEIDSILPSNQFIRINKSQIVHKKYIKEIKPTLNSKIILILKRNEKIYVSRNYIQEFKRFIGI